MKILAVCGHGLGSSFMLEMNIKKVLTELGKEAEVSHSDFASIIDEDADIFVMGQDIAASAPVSKDKVIALHSIIDKNEILEKLKERL